MNTQEEVSSTYADPDDNDTTSMTRDSISTVHYRAESNDASSVLTSVGQTCTITSQNTAISQIICEGTNVAIALDDTSASVSEDHNTRRKRNSTDSPESPTQPRARSKMSFSPQAVLQRVMHGISSIASSQQNTTTTAACNSVPSNYFRNPQHLIALTAGVSSGIHTITPLHGFLLSDEQGAKVQSTNWTHTVTQASQITSLSGACGSLSITSNSIAVTNASLGRPNVSGGFTIDTETLAVNSRESAIQSENTERTSFATAAEVFQRQRSSQTANPVNNATTPSSASSTRASQSTPSTINTAPQMFGPALTIDFIAELEAFHSQRSRITNSPVISTRATSSGNTFTTHTQSQPIQNSSAVSATDGTNAVLQLRPLTTSTPSNNQRSPQSQNAVSVLQNAMLSSTQTQPINMWPRLISTSPNAVGSGRQFEESASSSATRCVAPSVIQVAANTSPLISTLAVLGRTTTSSASTATTHSVSIAIGTSLAPFIGPLRPLFSSGVSQDDNTGRGLEQQQTITNLRNTINSLLNDKHTMTQTLKVCDANIECKSEQLSKLRKDYNEQQHLKNTIQDSLQKAKSKLQKCEQLQSLAFQLAMKNTQQKVEIKSLKLANKQLQRDLNCRLSFFAVKNGSSSSSSRKMVEKARTSTETGTSAEDNEELHIVSSDDELLAPLFADDTEPIFDNPTSDRAVDNAPRERIGVGNNQRIQHVANVQTTETMLASDAESANPRNPEEPWPSPYNATATENVESNGISSVNAAVETWTEFNDDGTVGPTSRNISLGDLTTRYVTEHNYVQVDSAVGAERDSPPPPSTTPSLSASSSSIGSITLENDSDGSTPSVVHGGDMLEDLLNNNIDQTNN